jgi:hypothetical protein
LRLISPSKGSPFAAAAVLLSAPLFYFYVVSFDRHELDGLVEFRRAVEDVVDARDPARFTPRRLRLRFSEKNEVQIDTWTFEARAQSYIGASQKALMPARLVASGESFAVKARLKGDWTDYLGGSYLGLRVELRGDDRYWGMRAFNLQPPSTRNYLFEWAFMRACEKAGLLTPKHEFVQLAVGGRPEMTYLLIEHFSKELVERQGRREGVIVKFDEGNYFELGARKESVGREGWPTASLSVFGEANVAKDRGLAAQRAAALAALNALRHGTRPPSDVLKVEETARYLALIDVFGAGHALAWHNFRFYYDPVVGRLEPIAWDGNAGALRYGPDPPRHGGFSELIFTDPVISRAYTRELIRFVQPEFVQSFLAEENLELAKRHAMLVDGDPTYRRGADEIALALDHYTAFLRAELAASDLALARSARLADGSFHVWVHSRVPFALELLGVAGSEHAGPVERREDLSLGAWLPRTTYSDVRSDEALDVARLQLPSEGGTPEYLTVRLAGATDSDGTRVPIAPLSPGLVQGITDRVTTDQSLRWKGDHWAWSASPSPPPALPAGWSVTPARPDQPRWVSPPPGESELSNDLLLPDGYGLRLLAGTTLRIADQRVMAIHGPLDVRGRVEAPVVLAPANRAWAGLVVLASPQGSRIRHLRMSGVHPAEGLRGPAREGWFQTGGLVFAGSDLHAEGLHLEDFGTEDALNVVSAELVLRNSTIRRVASDALDGDFITGRIEGVEVIDAGGDGFDFSGSRVALEDLRTDGVKDKAVSVGERSEVSLRGLAARRGRFAVVAKDGSRLHARDVAAEDVWVAMAAYTKKGEFGPANLEVANLQLTRQTFSHLAQEESTVVLDGRRLSTREFDSEDLYAD